MKVVNDSTWIDNLRAITPEDPLRVLVSGCIAGLPCGVDGTDYGMSGSLDGLLELPTVEVVSFCPEDHGLGTPRTMPDLHGGDGAAVLAGRAQVLDEHGADLTTGMVKGAKAMVRYARKMEVELCILTDMSGACGTQVISDGCRFDEDRKYQRGFGVAAAALDEAGFALVSQRDYASLGALRAILEPDFVPDETALDHHQTEWFKAYFRTG